jgi:hypothetical protein
MSQTTRPRKQTAGKGKSLKGSQASKDSDTNPGP